MTLPEFDQLARPLPEPHMLVESTGRVVAGNRAAARLFGLSTAALSGADLPSLLAMDRTRVLEYLAAAASSGQLVPGRLRVAVGGSVEAFPVGGGVVRPAAGDEPAMVLLRIDTSDQGNPFLVLNRKIEELSAEIRRRMSLEEERAQLLESERDARARAEEASRLKDDFLATLSHELRTPLNAIIGWASILQEGSVGPEKHALALQTIERAARSQAQLVEDLLDFSRIVGGQARLDVRSVNVAEVVRGAVETVRPTAEAKDIRLDTVLDPRAGPVSGDPERLQQVMWNLLSNAIKFSPRGGRVQVRVERINSHVEIIVADRGEGIPPEFLPHVFDRFRQADSSRSRAYGGIGLGLSIARHLVEAHAGVIHAASEGVGKGATFTVMLPLQLYQKPASLAGDRRHPTAEAGAGVEAPGLEPAERLDGVSVVILEDHADSRETLTVLLTQRGATVRAAGSAAEARTLLVDALPDVVLADIDLPGEDGYTFVRKLRSEPEERGGALPAIAITAFARRVDRVRALEAGFQMHMPKPVDSDELVATIRAVARKS